MSKHIHACENAPNTTAQVPSLSATASPSDDTPCHADHHRQMTRECEVEQDAILDDHVPDGQGECQRSTDSLSSCCGSNLERGKSQRTTCSYVFLIIIMIPCLFSSAFVISRCRPRGQYLLITLCVVCAQLSEYAIPSR